MATKKLKPPTVEYILGRRKELKKRYEDELEMLDQIRKLRTLAQPVNVPPRLQEMVGGVGLEYRDATIAAELLDLPTMFTKQPPELALVTGQKTIKVGDLLTRLEKFTTTSLLDEIGAREAGPTTFERMVDGCFEGGAWTKLVPTKDLWDERYKIRSSQFEDSEDGSALDQYDAATEKAKLKHAAEKQGVPISWIACDTATLLPDYAGSELVGMIEVQKRSLSETFRRERLGFNADGEIVPEETSTDDWEKTVGDNAEIELIQHVDAEWCTYLIEGAKSGDRQAKPYQLKQWKHKAGIGRPYYFFTPGWMPGFMRGRLVGWSASETKRYLVEHVSFLRTLFAYLSIRDAMVPLSEQSDPEGRALIGDDGQPRGPEPYELGMKYVTAGPLKAIEFPNSADKLQAEIQAARQDIAELSSSKPDLSGDLGGAGFAMSTGLERDARRYSQFENSITRTLNEITHAFWKMVHNLDEPVYVLRTIKEDAGYIKVEPSDFDTPVRATWKLSSSTQAAQIILQRFLESCRDAGWLSDDQCIEILGFNPSEVSAGKAADRVRKQPFYTQWEDGQIVADWGIDLLGMQQQAEQMAQFTQQANQAVQIGAGGMGSGGLPGQMGDPGAMTMSPNGAGAAPGTELQAPPIQVGQPVGMPSSPSVPTQAATAQLG